MPMIFFADLSNKFLASNNLPKPFVLLVLGQNGLTGLSDPVFKLFHCIDELIFDNIIN